MRPLLKRGMVVVVLAALAFSLRRDLVQLAWHQGNSSLHGMDGRGAEIAFRRAIALGGSGAPLLYNLGVSLYRQGEFKAAKQQFAAALASAGPELAATIHFNIGNCQYRLAERQAANNSAEIKRLLQGAVADYGKALASKAVGVNARDNLELARAKLVAFGNGDQNDLLKREQTTSGDASGDGPKARTQDKTKIEMMSAKSTAVKGNAEGLPREADRAEAGLAAGTPRIDLTRGDAEPLLNEARGREGLFGLPHGGGRMGPAEMPQRNW